MVHAQSLRGYPELVGDLGGNPARLLRTAGIDPRVLNQFTAFITFENLIDLLECSADELDCPDFGLRLAERQDLGILDTLAVAMRNSTTVGEAMEYASRYLAFHNAAIAFTVSTTERRGQARMAFGVVVEHTPRWAQTAEHGIGLLWRILCLLSEGHCHLQQVWLPHGPVAAESSYRSRFAAPLTFGADRLALAVAASDLAQPISEHHPELRDLATAYLDRQLPHGPSPLTLQARQTIEALLGTGTSSYSEVARALYMHPRTLQRRLREEGTTFEAIKDDVRRDRAERYLAHQDMPRSQVSALLDYSEQSALGRASRRWFHASPKVYRQHLAAPVPVPATA
jgi:AraC-like DNA-binding protein